MAEAVEVLEFDLGADRYCVDIRKVLEVVEKEDDLTSVPNVPPYVEGVMDLRGDTTTIVDPRRLYGLECDGAADGETGEQIIVFDEEAVDHDGVMGWSVDEVYRVSVIDPDDVDTTANDDESTQGIVNTDEGFMIWTSPAGAMG